LKNNYNLKAAFTGSDKDVSEIAAIRGVFDTVKHLLCYWHCIRAVKTRLSILRRTPGPYNVEQARNEFPWIDKDFVPIAQASNHAVCQLLCSGPPVTQFSHL
jgi:hypothetical protein